ncbi:MAG: hypothetical protein H6R05_282 [Burkholderiaceae bacterium]|nr:hypothetical protein [Burkholderiaceae bacterium]
MKNLYKGCWLAGLLVVSQLSFAQVNCNELAPVPPQAATSKAVIKKQKSVHSKSNRKAGITKTVRSQLIYHYGDVVVESQNGTRQSVGAEALSTLPVSNGDVIYTGEQSFAVIKLYDGSQITIPSASKVRLQSIRQLPISIELLEGRVDSAVTPTLDRKGLRINKGYGFLLATPSLNLGVRGTQFKVEHAKEVSFVSVEEGEVVIQRASSCERPLSLTKKDGAFVSAPKIKQIRALDAPKLLNMSDVFRGDEVRIKFPEVVGAKRYHVQAAHDADFVYLFEESYSDLPELKLSTLDNGYYHIKVTAIDQDGVEGMPAEKRILFQYK